MKKISLKNLNLNETEALSREQLKNVLGGYGGGTTGTIPLPTGGPNCSFTCECIGTDGSYSRRSFLNPLLYIDQEVLSH